MSLFAGDKSKQSNYLRRNIIVIKTLLSLINSALLSHS